MERLTVPILVLKTLLRDSERQLHNKGLSLILLFGFINAFSQDNFSFFRKNPDYLSPYTYVTEYSDVPLSTKNLAPGGPYKVVKVGFLLSIHTSNYFEGERHPVVQIPDHFTSIKEDSRKYYYSLSNIQKSVRYSNLEDYIEFWPFDVEMKRSIKVKTNSGDRIDIPIDSRVTPLASRSEDELLIEWKGNDYTIDPDATMLIYDIRNFIDPEKQYEEPNGSIVTLPQGDISFADKVISYDYVGEAPWENLIHKNNSPQQSLGPPDKQYDQRNVHPLGCGGSIVLEFIDNRLIDTKGDDLYIFEGYNKPEPTDIFISNDLEDWIYVGVATGWFGGVDIEPYVTQGEEFKYVKLVDKKEDCQQPPGADVDAVAAIGSINLRVPRKRIEVQNPVTEHDIDRLKNGESVVLQDILFYRQTSRLKSEGFESLNKIIQFLEKTNVKVEVSGHTEDRGNKKANLKLSQERAEKVKEFLIQNGIKKKRIEAVGYGEEYPIASNEDEETRKLNRRVELKIIQ